MSRIPASVRVGAVAWAVALSVPLASASPVTPVLSVAEMVPAAETIPAEPIAAGRPTHSNAATGTKTLYVDPAGTKTTGCTGPGVDACKTIAQGVAAAIAGTLYNNFDVIVQVAAGTYVENPTVNPDGLFSLTLIAPAGPSATTIDGGGAPANQTVLTIQAGTNAGIVTVDGFTVRNGRPATLAGGIRVFEGGKLAVVGSVIKDNDGEFGGGINVRPTATVSVTRSTISGNIGSRNGGGIHNNGSLTVTDSTISGNTAPTSGGGGGIVNVNGGGGGAVLTVTGSTIVNNSTGGPGGGIFNFAQTATVTGSTILGNTASSANAIFSPSAIKTDVIGSILGGGCGGNAVTDGGTGGYNLKSTNTCGTASGDVVDAGLTGVSTTLAANGSTGPLTLALDPTTAARKLVPAALCAAADERGASRPGDDTQTKCDAGAFELQVTPGTPTGVIATAGVGSASVVFTAPTSFDGVTVTGYTLTAIDSTNAANGGQICIPVPPTAPSCTFPGLTPGDSYTFTVRATGPTGNGAPSAPSNAVVPFTLPGAPTNVTATAGSSRATVSFSPPTSNGFTPITKYTVTAAPGGKTCTVTLPAASLSCAVLDLTPGTSYTFTVKATNLAGDGPASAASNSVVPFTVPGPPTGVDAIPGDVSAEVSFTAPAANGFTPITGYTITATDLTDAARGGQTCTAAPGETSCTITGLTNGDSYTFTVVARNAAGDGPPSAPSAAVVPTAPPGLRATTERSPLRNSTRCSGGPGPSASNDPGPC